MRQLRDRLRQRFTLAVEEKQHEDDIAYVERYASWLSRLFAVLKPRYRRIRQEWTAYRVPNFDCSLLGQAATMKDVDRLRAERRVIAAMEGTARAMFGSHWHGEESDWNALERYLAWVPDFRALCRSEGLTSLAVTLAAQAAPNVSPLRSLAAATAQSSALLRQICDIVGWPAGYLQDEPLDKVELRIQRLVERLAEGPQWVAFESARSEVSRTSAAGLLPGIQSGEIPINDVRDAFLRAFYQKWLAGVVNDREPLSRFHTASHEERVAEFRQLDKLVLSENRAALIRQMRDKVQQEIQRPDIQAGKQFLQRQLARQRGHAPLRRTMSVAGSAIRVIKPCLLMSPLSVAQYLRDASSSFDLVIFDEASQLPPQDAAGAILRGKQVVVVGDPKQLPPTNFFNVIRDDRQATLANDGTPIYEDSESILEDFLGASMPSTRLQWHYRSAHESLIPFSNVNFYDAALYTFPSVER